VPRYFAKTLCVLLLLVLPGSARPDPGGGIRDCALLIGWDGVGREAVAEGIRRGILPNLKVVCETGSLVPVDISGATTSKPGWAQVLTGCFPERTGVYDDANYRPIPPGFTVFERLKRHYGGKGIFTAVIACKSNPFRRDPPRLVPATETPFFARVLKKLTGGRLGGPRELREVPGQPYCHASASIDCFVTGLGGDIKAALEASRVIAEARGRPFFIFVHFGGPDITGHLFGGWSPEYWEALRRVDYLTGALIGQLKLQGIEQLTWVYVTSDHGFDPGKKDHREAARGFLACDDPRVRLPGGREDTAPTILEGLGFDLSELRPSVDGRSLRAPAVGGAAVSPNQ